MIRSWTRLREQLRVPAGLLEQAGTDPDGVNTRRSLGGMLSGVSLRDGRPSSVGSV
ncbi:hypothetical protein [Nocardia cerradoensis]|uniref:hypothetical protein n=1 Tax=Nocardia cerradoensis TaxID=85688 RepID=UPI0002EF5C77|nr:hypothetical protein [Nocardia cerradoensis]NKY42639.1 hypothetical protein [Nocardia cerradoensis]